jgi:hypothetical protein
LTRFIPGAKSAHISEVEFMTNVFAALGLVMTAGLTNAAFALPMRYNRIWKWENTWLVFSICSLGVIPWLLVLLLVHRLPELLASLTLRDVAPALLFGFLWGIAMATFGLALALLGISIVVPIVSALTLIVGTFTPILARHPALLRERAGIMMEFSAVLLVGSLLLYGKAARSRLAVRPVFHGPDARRVYRHFWGHDQRGLCAER